MKKDAKIVGVWGGRGSGKSTRIKELTKTNNRLIVLDPIGDYAQGGGFSEFRTLKGLFRHIKANWSKGFRCVLVVPRGSDAQGVLEILSDALFKIQEPYYHGKDTRKLTLVVEEMALCYPERTLGKAERNFMELINLGRHSGVEIIGASQRIAEVKKNFVGNCAEHYFFRMGSAVDYTASKQMIGAEHIGTHKKLQTHEFIHFCQGVVKAGKNKCNFRKRR